MTSKLELDHPFSLKVFSKRGSHCLLNVFRIWDFKHIVTWSMYCPRRNEKCRRNECLNVPAFSAVYSRMESGIRREGKPLVTLCYVRTIEDGFRRPATAFVRAPISSWAAGSGDGPGIAHSPQTFTLFLKGVCIWLSLNGPTGFCSLLT